MHGNPKANWWWSTALVVACLATACRPADPTLVKIVSSLPRTGSAKQQSDTIVRGIRMAIDEAQGRVGPFRIESVSYTHLTLPTILRV